MKKTILLSGANGYLGRYVIEKAIKNGYSVIGLKYNHFRSTLIKHPDVEYIDVDITLDLNQNQELTQVVRSKNIVGIVNAAALLGSSDLDKNDQVNHLGVKNLMEWGTSINITRFIQISSVVVLKKIKGPYGITKLRGQQAVEASNLDYTIFIPAMILGPESMGLNRILKNVYRFPFFVPLIGSGKQTQHPIYVKDFAKAIVNSLENRKTYKKVYEIAGDEVISFRNLIKLILQIKGNRKVFVPVPVFVAKNMGRFFQATQKVPVFTAEHVQGVLQDSKLDNQGLEEDIGFVPTPLSESLKDTLEVIGSDWNQMLQSKAEENIKIDLRAIEKSQIEIDD